MKTIFLIFLFQLDTINPVFQPYEKFWINYFKAIPLNKQENKFKVGVKQLGLFYINPDIENIEVISKDTLLLKGRLQNDNLDVSMVEVYLLKKYIRRRLPFLQKK